MNRKEQKTIIVTETIQRCTDCGWAHAPAVLAYNCVLRSAGFYCLNCFENASIMGDFIQREEVQS